MGDLTGSCEPRARRHVTRGTMNALAGKSDRQLRQKILVVDDEQVILDLLRRVLSREGYEVATTTRGDEAVRLVSTGRFDLAIADIGLHRLDGRDLMMRINQASPETALVAMTGYPASEVVEFAQDYTDGYLEKPFALEELLRAVRRALEERVKLSGEAAAIASTSS
jgi:DNA-binding NtrC family response regulator